MSETEDPIQDLQTPHCPLFDGALAIVCMPVLYHVEPESFESITIAMSKFGREKLRFMAQEKTCVWESRNLLAQRFLRTDAEWMIFIDGDMFIPSGNADYFNSRARVKFPNHIAGLNFFERMLTHPNTYRVLGASYFDRMFGNQLQCSRGCGSSAEVGFNERYKRGEYSGVGEVLWTATGGMRIHRSVFEQIQKHKAKFPEMVPHKEGFRWGFFNPMKVGMGEDVAFCARARASGFKIWQDYDLRILHKGSVHR
jgi:hypothetical protein